MDETKPKASIIIPTYNRARILLKRSLPSALKQAYPNYEIIMVDDCSTDETNQVIKNLMKRGAKIKYLKLKKNSGVSKARNLGVENANGKYIVFIDDDNELMPNFLETTVPILENLPKEFGGISCGRIIIHKRWKEYHPPFDGKSFYSAIDWGWLLRKNIFLRIKYDERLRADEDADFGIRFFQYYKAYPIDKPLEKAYTYIDDKGQPSVCLPTKQRIKSLDIFLEKNLPIYKKEGNKKELSFIYRFAGRNYCLGKQNKKGVSFFRQAFLVKPNIRNFLNLLVACFGCSVYRIYWNIEKKLANFIRSNFTHWLPK